MRVLLDECLPRRLKREIVGHDARTVPEMPWASKRNGELLALAAAEFDMFLTADRNRSYQQDVSAFDIAVVVLVQHHRRAAPAGISNSGGFCQRRARSGDARDLQCIGCRT